MRSSMRMTCAPGRGAFEISDTAPPFWRKRVSASLAAGNAETPLWITPQTSESTAS